MEGEAAAPHCIACQGCRPRGVSCTLCAGPCAWASAHLAPFSPVRTLADTFCHPLFQKRNEGSTYPPFPRGIQVQVCLRLQTGTSEFLKKAENQVLGHLPAGQCLLPVNNTEIVYRVFH